MPESLNIELHARRIIKYAGKMFLLEHESTKTRKFIFEKNTNLLFEFRRDILIKKSNTKGIFINRL